MHMEHNAALPNLPYFGFFKAYILAATALNGKDFECFPRFSLIVAAEADSILPNQFWGKFEREKK